MRQPLNFSAKVALATDSDKQKQDYLVGLHPIGCAGSSNEIAQAVAFLCADEASFITGTNLTVDGGYTAQ